MMSRKTKLFLLLSLFLSLVLWPGMFLFERARLLRLGECSSGLTRVLLGASGQCPFKFQKQPPPQPKLRSFFLDSTGENLVVETENLSRVEIWGKQGEQEVFWGQAVLVSEENNRQRWLFRIPREPVLVTELLSLGFDQEGRLVSKLSFPVAGASALYQVFWAAPNQKVFGVEPNEEFKLFPGQVGVLNNSDLAVSFSKVIQDSRCPIGAYCPLAGEVRVELKLYSKEQLPLPIVLILDSRQPNLAIFQTNNYAVELVSVLPFPFQGKKIRAEDYQVVLRINQR